MVTAPAQKEVGYFSANACRRHNRCPLTLRDFGFSRSKWQLFEDYGIVAPLECV
jgi:hypothetical protein